MSSNKSEVAKQQKNVVPPVNFLSRERQVDNSVKRNAEETEPVVNLPPRSQFVRERQVNQRAASPVREKQLDPPKGESTDHVIKSPELIDLRVKKGPNLFTLNKSAAFEVKSNNRDYENNSFQQIMTSRKNTKTDDEAVIVENKIIERTSLDDVDSSYKAFKSKKEKTNEQEIDVASNTPQIVQKKNIEKTVLLEQSITREASKSRLKNVKIKSESNKETILMTAKNDTNYIRETDARSITDNEEDSSDDDSSDEDDTSFLYEPNSMQAECEKCKKKVKTHIYHKTGKCTWTLCILFFFFGLWPFILLLFLTNCSKNVIHNCTQCQSYMGVYKRPDDMERLKRKQDKEAKLKKKGKRNKVSNSAEIP